MNATEARLRRANRSGSTLAERLRRDPDMARRINEHRQMIALEEQVVAALKMRSMTFSDLSRRLDRAPSSVTRDLKGGLSEAKLGRIRRYAEVLGCELRIELVPRDELAVTHR